MNYELINLKDHINKKKNQQIICLKLTYFIKQKLKKRKKKLVKNNVNIIQQFHISTNININPTISRKINVYRQQ